MLMNYINKGIQKVDKALMEMHAEHHLEKQKDQRFSQIDLDSLNQIPIELVPNERGQNLLEAFLDFKKTRNPEVLKEQGLEHVQDSVPRSYLSTNVIHDNDPQEIIPGIYNHAGVPNQGDTIAYLSNSKELLNLGIYEGPNKAISKLSPKGPLVRHNLTDMLPKKGGFALFSTYKFKNP